jgi:hypothetical protein
MRLITILLRLIYYQQLGKEIHYCRIRLQRKHAVLAAERPPSVHNLLQCYP